MLKFGDSRQVDREQGDSIDGLYISRFARFPSAVTLYGSEIFSLTHIALYLVSTQILFLDP
jgi:hypothetical protein